MLKKLLVWIRRKDIEIASLKEERDTYVEAIAEMGSQDATRDTRIVTLEKALEDSERDFGTLQRQFADYRVNTGNKLNAIRDLVN